MTLRGPLFKALQGAAPSALSIAVLGLDLDDLAGLVDVDLFIVLAGALDLDLVHELAVVMPRLRLQDLGVRADLQQRLLHHRRDLLNWDVEIGRAHV